MGWSVPSTWAELGFSRGFDHESERGRKTATAVWDAPSAGIEDAVSTYLPDYLAYPFDSGLFGRRLARVNVRREWRPTRSLVRAGFVTPTWGQILRKNPGRGVLNVRVTTDEVKGVMDLEGKKGVWYQTYLLEGGKYHLYRWQPISGKGTVLQARCVLALRVVANRFQVSTVMGLCDTVNNSVLRNFGNAGKEKLRFLGAESERELEADALSDVTWLFEFNPKGWNSDTSVQRQEYRLFQIPVYDEKGDAIAKKFHVVGNWFNYGAAYGVKLYKPTSWTVIDKMIGW